MPRSFRAACQNWPGASRLPWRMLADMANGVRGVWGLLVGLFAALITLTFGGRRLTGRNRRVNVQRLPRTQHRSDHR
jgi:hypothetical protein